MFIHRKATASATDGQVSSDESKAQFVLPDLHSTFVFLALIIVDGLAEVVVLHPLLKLFVDDEREEVVAVGCVRFDGLPVDVLRAPFQVNDGVADVAEGLAALSLRVGLPAHVLRKDVVSDGADVSAHRKLDVVRYGDDPVLVLLYVVINQRVERLHTCSVPHGWRILRLSMGIRIMSPKAESSKLTWRDFLTLTLSVLAFLMSLATAYLTIIRQTDELRLVISSAPATFIEKRRIELGDFSVSYINSGNRSAVIHYIWVIIDQETPGPSSNCARGREAGFDPTAVVIKEKEVVATRIKAHRVDVKSEKDERIGVPLTNENLKSGYFPYEVCLGFFISTPSQVMVKRTVSVFKTDKYDLVNGFVGQSSDEKKTDRPLVLIRRTGNIFTD